MTPGLQTSPFFYRDASNYLGMSASELVKENLKVAIKISQWNDFVSFTAQRMTIDPIVLGKFSGYRHAQIDLSSVEHHLTTRVRNKLKQIIDVEGRRLSFIDVVASPSIETPRTVEDHLTTRVRNKSKQIIDVEGRRLSFIDVVASPSIETLRMGKRFVTKLSDDGQSSGEYLMNLDIPLQKIKLEKN
ncbi:uncharacterized protein G2W53_003713 [Senna tora]|uniref:Uncharacterized protein n=1 Tax=Senna tora TaxID=362788 RepID=A0A834XB58_9FABA|nr:uncharacterized protein G2W53_003713 [Senna tora]